MLASMDEPKLWTCIWVYTKIPLTGKLNQCVNMFLSSHIYSKTQLSWMQHLVCRYAQYGDVSPKVDVYAFGVVLYELISAKDAIVKTNEFVSESMGLVALVISSALSLVTTYACSPKLTSWEFTQIVSIDLMQFEDVLSQPDPKEDLLKLVDPRLGNNCPLESVSKVIISHSNKFANPGLLILS